MLEHGHDDWEEESCGFSGTSLRTSHEVTSSMTNGHGVFLYWSRLGISTKLGIPHQLLSNCFNGVHIDGIRNVITSSLDGDIIIVVKVDSRFLNVIPPEKRSLQTRIGFRITVESTFVDTRTSAAIPSTTASTAISTSYATTSITTTVYTFLSSRVRITIVYITPTTVGGLGRTTLTAIVIAVTPAISTAVSATTFAAVLVTVSPAVSTAVSATVTGFATE